MDYITIINMLIALMTAAFGCFGFFAPRYTASVIDLEPTTSTMGLSELRAGNGGLFIALGIWCLMTAAPYAFFMLGVAYVGAGAGRLVSLVLDKPPFKKAATWMALEWIPAAFLIWSTYAAVAG